MCKCLKTEGGKGRGNQMLFIVSSLSTPKNDFPVYLHNDSTR